MGIELAEDGGRVGSAVELFQRALDCSVVESFSIISMPCCLPRRICAADIALGVPYWLAQCSNSSIVILFTSIEVKDEEDTLCALIPYTRYRSICGRVLHAGYLSHDPLSRYSTEKMKDAMPLESVSVTPIANASINARPSCPMHIIHVRAPFSASCLFQAEGFVAEAVLLLLRRLLCPCLSLFLAEVERGVRRPESDGHLVARLRNRGHCADWVPMCSSQGGDRPILLFFSFSSCTKSIHRPLSQ